MDNLESSPEPEDKDSDFDAAGEEEEKMEDMLMPVLEDRMEAMREQQALVEPVVPQVVDEPPRSARQRRRIQYVESDEDSDGKTAKSVRSGHDSDPEPARDVVERIITWRTIRVKKPKGVTPAPSNPTPAPTDTAKKTEDAEVKSELTESATDSKGEADQETKEMKIEPVEMKAEVKTEEAPQTSSDVTMTDVKHEEDAAASESKPSESVSDVPVETKTEQPAETEKEKEKVAETPVTVKSEGADDVEDITVDVDVDSEIVFEPDEYLVKWKGHSYLHCQWVDASVIQNEGPSGKAKLQRFVNSGVTKLVYDENSPEWDITEFIDPQFIEVDRIIAAKNHPDESGQVRRWYLVKWQNLPYSDCTWETEEDLGDEDQIKVFIQRNTIPNPLPRPNPPVVLGRKQNLMIQKRPQFSQLLATKVHQTVYKNDNTLREYQMLGVLKLLEVWSQYKNFMLADEMGLGKTVQSVILLHHLKETMGVRGPFLVAAPLSTLEQWRRTFENWTNMNVVMYHAPVGGDKARDFIREHEFYYTRNAIPPAVGGKSGAQAAATTSTTSSTPATTATTTTTTPATTTSAPQTAAQLLHNQQQQQQAQAAQARLPAVPPIGSLPHTQVPSAKPQSLPSVPVAQAGAALTPQQMQLLALQQRLASLTPEQQAIFQQQLTALRQQQQQQQRQQGVPVTLTPSHVHAQPPPATMTAPGPRMPQQSPQQPQQQQQQQQQSPAQAQARLPHLPHILSGTVQRPPQQTPPQQMMIPGQQQQHPAQQQHASQQHQQQHQQPQAPLSMQIPGLQQHSSAQHSPSGSMMLPSVRDLEHSSGPSTPLNSVSQSSFAAALSGTGRLPPATPSSPTVSGLYRPGTQQASPYTTTPAPTTPQQQPQQQPQQMQQSYPHIGVQQSQPYPQPQSQPPMQKQQAYPQTQAYPQPQASTPQQQKYPTTPQQTPAQQMYTTPSSLSQSQWMGAANPAQQQQQRLASVHSSTPTTVPSLARPPGSVPTHQLMSPQQLQSPMVGSPLQSPLLQAPPRAGLSSQTPIAHLMDAMGRPIGVSPSVRPLMPQATQPQQRPAGSLPPGTINPSLLQQNAMYQQQQQQLYQQQAAMRLLQQQQQQARAAAALAQSQQPPNPLSGADMNRIPGLYKFDVIITSYETVLRDKALQEIYWRYVVIDEAHRLKSTKAKLLQTMKDMACESKLLLTGTPLQNNTAELWSLLNFIAPEQFPNKDFFLRKYGTLSSAEQVGSLHQELRTVMLRRMKTDVEKSLPTKEETIIDVEMTQLQKKYYRAIFERNRAFLSKGCSPANMPHLINVAMELRKCTNHPFLIPGVVEKEMGTEHYDMERSIHSSGKMVLLDKLLPKLKAEGHRVLIFSQMTKMLDLLEDYMHHRHYTYERLDGSQRGSKRQEAIDRYCAPESDRFVFLLSTRAGGLGINLAVADTVIIYDSDWNPQNDIQAQARVHRIGQTKEVKVCRLVTGRTYEAEMFERASKKLGLDQAVFSTMGSQINGVVSGEMPDKEEINMLLKMGAYGALDTEEDASRKFQEEDIDQILKSRAHVVNYGEADTPANFSVTKASFKLAGSNEEVDVSDPDFWRKVLGPTRLEKLTGALNSDEIEEDRGVRREFFNDLAALVKEVLNARLMGSDHEDTPAVIEMLMRMRHLHCFTDKQRSLAQRWAQEIEQPRKRKRTKRVDLVDENDMGLPASLANLEEGSDVDDKRSRRKAKVAVTWDEFDPSMPLCSECFLPGDDLSICTGGCDRLLHPACGRLAPGGPKKTKSKGKGDDENDEYSQEPTTSEDPSEGMVDGCCQRCTQNLHPCGICARAQPTGKTDVPRRCVAPGCGHYYHLSCAKASQLFRVVATNIYCSLHICAECLNEGGEFYRCQRCPTAIHPHCVRPDYAGTRIPPSAMVCEVHFPGKRKRAITAAAVTSAYVPATPPRKTPTRSSVKASTGKSKRKRRSSDDEESDDAGGFERSTPVVSYREERALSPSAIAAQEAAAQYEAQEARLSRRRSTRASSRASSRAVRQAFKTDDEDSQDMSDHGGHQQYQTPQGEDVEDMEVLEPSGDWCRYCGARYSSGWNRGPWGPRKLCTAHYVEWYQKQTLNLDAYQEEPTEPIDSTKNTEAKYLSYRKKASASRKKKAPKRKVDSDEDSYE